MPPITNTQQDAIDNTKITTDQLENPTPTPNLPTSNIPDFSQYLTPSVGQQQELDTATQNRDVSLENLTSSMFGNETQGARTLGYEESAGIPRLQRELTDIENQLTQTDLNFRRERERIQTETGLTTGQRNARLNDVSRKQASQLADLEVIRAARSGVLSDAQSFVQRKTELEFADEKARIDNLKFIYENNEGKYKDALGKVIKTEERAFDLAKSKYETVENEKMQLVRNAQANGASNSVLSSILNSKTVEEAYKSAGNYGISIDDKIRNAQLDKLNKELDEAIEETPEASEMDKDPEFKKLKGNAELKLKLQAYQDLVTKYGAKRKGTASGAVLDNAYQEVLQAYRAAKDLGALQGSDAELIDDAIKRATFEKSGLGKIINVALLGIPSAIKKKKTTNVVESSIDEAFNSIDRATNQLTNTIKAKNPTWVDTPYFQTLTGSNISTDGGMTIDANGNIVIPGDESNEDYFNR